MDIESVLEVMDTGSVCGSIGLIVIRVWDELTVNKRTLHIGYLYSTKIVALKKWGECDNQVSNKAMKLIFVVIEPSPDTWPYVESKADIFCCFSKR